ncbi:hypothetical protein D9V37_15030 [Nocardioides mangrovicus]|uniref:HPr kinase/phosphorylase C-terminal domain-containing protein n=1 Tax=Nocardioides mangrovicus TaxID=2478913 RepID=A0A3L8NVZ0_9ACTN|nr:hypothetical protein [Nocardioides mangrovicus]RLV47496.1 hypothetical protein D9V37_15030 [Nocardioides mangrovicus]
MTGFGVYGLRLEGLSGALGLMAPARDGDPEIRVERITDPADRLPDPRFVLDRDRALLPLSDGESWAELRRGETTVRLWLGRDYTDEELLHPLLSGTCAVTNWWHGRDAMHAGAVVVDGRAWAVIGHKNQGKSTTLGYLASCGLPVLSDDVVVEDGGLVLPGPAFVDLRPDAARHLGLGRDLGVLGARPRYRYDVTPVVTGVPLAGWLLLEWGERTGLAPLSAGERIKVLLENRAVLLEPADPVALMGYAALPFLRLSRPRRWESLAEVAEVLAELPSGSV